jgi:hypothetical protein
MRSCQPERVERYRSNYSALLAAVEPFVWPRTDICTHNVSLRDTPSLKLTVDLERYKEVRAL